jgi:small subunit ribosomal protein S4
MREKQKVKKWYNVSELQFKQYVFEVMENRTKGLDVVSSLIGKLESRLDNMVFRMGWAKSRAQSRLIVSHGHILVNGKKVDVPSYRTKVGDIISIRVGSQGKENLKDIPTVMKKYSLPKWLSFDESKVEGKVIRLPAMEDIQLPSEVSSIFEHYSR